MLDSDDLFTTASQRRGNTLRSESPYMLLFPSFSSASASTQQQDTNWASSICARTRAPIKVNKTGWCMEDDLCYYADWKEVRDRKLSSQQLKVCLNQMEYERPSADEDTKKLIDWMRPIYEDHLSSELDKERYEKEMAVWNSPEAEAEREKATNAWIERRFNSPEMVEYRKKVALLDNAWSRGFRGTHEDIFGPWKE